MQKTELPFYTLYGKHQSSYEKAIKEHSAQNKTVGKNIQIYQVEKFLNLFLLTLQCCGMLAF